MGFAVRQRAAYAREKHRTVFFRRRGFPAVRVKVGIAVEQFLRGNEGDFAFQFQVYDGEIFLGFFQRIDYRAHYARHRHFEKFGRALFLGNDHLPVPLVDVNGMHVVALVVAAYGVHIRVKPFAPAETVAF